MRRKCELGGPRGPTNRIKSTGGTALALLLAVAVLSLLLAVDDVPRPAAATTVPTPGAATPRKSAGGGVGGTTSHRKGKRRKSSAADAKKDASPIGRDRDDDAASTPERRRPQSNATRRGSRSGSTTPAMSGRGGATILRLRREWRDCVDAGLGYDWIRGRCAVPSSSSSSSSSGKGRSARGDDRGDEEMPPSTNGSSPSSETGEGEGDECYLRLGPLRSNLLSWHFSVVGPPGPKSPYARGIYHGRILLPPDYPTSPPRVQLLTPNGRFRTRVDVCLSASNYHPESWTPRWTVANLVRAVRLHMLTDPNEIGGVVCSDEERRRLAARSAHWRCMMRAGNKGPAFVVDHGAMVRSGAFGGSRRRDAGFDEDGASAREGTTGSAGIDDGDSMGVETTPRPSPSAAAAVAVPQVEEESNKGPPAKEGGATGMASSPPLVPSVDGLGRLPESESVSVAPTRQPATTRKKKLTQRSSTGSKKRRRRRRPPTSGVGFSGKGEGDHPDRPGPPRRGVVTVNTAGGGEGVLSGVPPAEVVRREASATAGRRRRSGVARSSSETGAVGRRTAVATAAEVPPRPRPRPIGRRVFDFFLGAIVAMAIQRAAFAALRFVLDPFLS